MKLQKKIRKEPSVKYAVIFNSTGAIIVINPKNVDDIIRSKNGLYCPDIVPFSAIPLSYWKKVGNKIGIKTESEKKFVDAQIRIYGYDISRELEFYDVMELEEMNGNRPHLEESFELVENYKSEEPEIVVTSNFWLHFWILLLIVVSITALYFIM